MDTAIERVTGDPKKVHHPVTLRLMELGVKMSCNDTGDAVLHYTYPEVWHVHLLTWWSNLGKWEVVKGCVTRATIDPIFWPAE